MEVGEGVSERPKAPGEIQFGKLKADIKSSFSRKEQKGERLPFLGVVKDLDNRGLGTLILDSEDSSKDPFGIVIPIEKAEHFRRVYGVVDSPSLLILSQGLAVLSRRAGGDYRFASPTAEKASLLSGQLRGEDPALRHAAIYGNYVAQGMSWTEARAEVGPKVEEFLQKGGRSLYEDAQTRREKRDEYYRKQWEKLKSAPYRYDVLPSVEFTAELEDATRKTQEGRDYIPKKDLLDIVFAKKGLAKGLSRRIKGYKPPLEPAAYSDNQESILQSIINNKILEIEEVFTEDSDTKDILEKASSEIKRPFPQGLDKITDWIGRRIEYKIMKMVEAGKFEHTKRPDDLLDLWNDSLSQKPETS